MTGNKTAVYGLKVSNLTLDFRNRRCDPTLVNMPRFYLHNRLNERKGRKFAALGEASALDRMPAALIPRNAEPVGHISPYPRIDLSPVRTATAQPQVVSAVEESKRIVEAERIWRIVVQVAQGN